MSTFSALSAIAIGTALFVAPPTAADTAREQLDALFRGLHADDEFHGSVLVAEGGQVVYEACFGPADLKTGARITPRTRFEIASVTKPITVTAALILVERGAFALDDPVRKVLPDFPYAGVTVRQLMNHTSGLPEDDAIYRTAADRISPENVVTNERAYRFLRECGLPPRSEPGTAFDYNNVNSIVVARIVEAASGMPFARFMREAIFEPAGMVDTEVYCTRFTEGSPPRFAEGYMRGQGGAWVHERDSNAGDYIAAMGGTAGDSGIVSTARDLFRFVQALDDDTLLSAKRRAEVRKPTVAPDGTEIWDQDWTTSNYCLGWRLRDDRDTLFHTGNWGGYLCAVWRYPAKDRVVVYLKNRRAQNWSWIARLEAIVNGEASLLDDSDPAPRGAAHLDGAAAVEDARLLARTLTELHAGFGRYVSTEAMQALFDDLERDVADGVDALTFYRRVSQILPYLRCDHTLAETPAWLASERTTTSSYLPFTFRLFDGRMYVDRAQSPGLERGDEVLAINGRAVAAILGDVRPYIPVDGWTDHAKVAAMEYGTEFMGDAVDHFWPLLYGWPKDWTLRVRRGTGAIETVRRDALTYPQWLELAANGSGRWVNFPESVAFAMPDDATGRLTIGTFVNYRAPVEPADIFDPIFDRLRDAGAEHLVIDLRSCGGGSTDVPDALLTYLFETAPASGRRKPWTRCTAVGDLRPYLSTWDESIFHAPPELFRDLGNGAYELQLPMPGPAATRANRFTGKVTLLVGPANSSGATVFAAVARAHHPNLRVVGAPTGGSAEGPTAGTIVFLDLPNSGIRVRVPLLRSWANVAHPEPGMGVVPDIDVRATADDWRAGRDVVLEAALRR